MIQPYTPQWPQSREEIPADPWLDFLEWTEAEAAELAAVDWAALAELLTARFYEKIQAQPDLDALVRRHASYDQLGQALRAYIRSLGASPVGDGYRRQMQRIAEAHVRVGLTPDWYMAAYRIF